MYFIMLKKLRMNRDDDVMHDNKYSYGSHELIKKLMIAVRIITRKK